MNRLILALALLLGISARAADRITVQLILTNAPLVGDSVTINGTDTRTWATTNSPTTIQTNASVLQAATNLWIHFASYPVPATTLILASSNEVQLISLPGSSLTASSVTNWVDIQHSTNSVASSQVLRVPMSTEPIAQRTNMASLLARDIEAYSPTPFGTGTVLLSSYADLSTPQTFTGVKTLLGGIITNGLFDGEIGLLIDGMIDGATITNSILYGEIGLLINGTVDGAVLTNGIFDGAISVLSGGLIDGSTLTNGTLYGTVGLLSGGVIDGTSHTAGIYEGTIDILSGGLITTTVIGGATITNTVIFQADIVDAWAKQFRLRRNNHESLVSGDNAGVILTNAFNKISTGPAGAFTIHGLAAGEDGEVRVIYNATGFDMTLTHQSGTEPSAANRIITMTGASVATTGNGTATLLYDNDATRWILISSSP